MKNLAFFFTFLAGQLLAQTTIITQTTNELASAGGSIVLSVTVSGTGPFTCQWQHDGTNLPNNVITTVAGNGTGGFLGDGGAATNAMIAPNGVTLDGLGDLFIADRGNFRVREVNTNGVISTIGGNGTPFYSGDGGAATNAGMYAPVGLAVNGAGNVFVADINERRIREIDTNGIITTFAGGGTNTADGIIATNALIFPTDVAVGPLGNLYLTDGNRIRKVDTNGIITTVAGNSIGGYSGDGGTATNASLAAPQAIAVDASGNLLIADTENNCIRKVDTNGIITTVAGNGGPGFSGDGGIAANAELNVPTGVAADRDGDLFITDYPDNRIREVNTNGIITTVAGNGLAGYSGDGGAATSASLDGPQRISVDETGNLFIADAHNLRIREVHLAGLPHLTLANLTTDDSGDYSVVITDSSGSVTDLVATVTVVLPPTIQVSRQVYGQFDLTWDSVSNLTYQLQYTTNLAAHDWINIGNPIMATNGPVSVSEIVGSAVRRFYRLDLSQPN